jgi:hypothetical protein
MYRVIDFGLLGAMTGEFGGTAAEVVAPDFKKLIFITDLGTSGAPGEPDGALYRYFFWDAYQNGMLTDHPEREARLHEIMKQRKEDETFQELRTRMRFDSVMSFQDLWTTLAYCRLSTVWCPLVANSPTRPRRKYSDSEIGPLLPFKERYTASQNAPNMKIVRGWCTNGAALVSGLDADPSGSPLVKNAKLCFPEPCRKRTIILAIHDSPYYVDQLERTERATYRQLFGVAVRLLERAGFTALEIGKDYSTDDFYDRCHLSEQGGARLAEDVAAKVRELAERLGYIEEGSKP